MTDVLPRLQQLFRDVLGDRDLVLTPESNAETIEGYDSMVHINIISAVEQEFGLRFEAREILELESTADLIALIERQQRLAA